MKRSSANNGLLHRRRRRAGNHSVRFLVEMLEDRTLLTTYTVASTGTGNVAGTLLYEINQLNSNGAVFEYHQFQYFGFRRANDQPDRRPANDHQAGHDRGDREFRSTPDSDPGRLSGKQCKRPHIRKRLLGFERPGFGDRGFW